MAYSFDDGFQPLLKRLVTLQRIAQCRIKILRSVVNTHGLLQLPTSRAQFLGFPILPPRHYRPPVRCWRVTEDSGHHRRQLNSSHQ